MGKVSDSIEAACATDKRSMLSKAGVTQLLNAYVEGDHHALDRLMPVVYEQLRRLAHARLRNERPDHTLNTTGLVHEAYLKLVDIAPGYPIAASHQSSAGQEHTRTIVLVR